MSWRLFTWWVSVKLFSAFMFFLSSKLHKADDNCEQSDERSVDVDMNDDNVKDNVAMEVSATNHQVHL